MAMVISWSVFPMDFSSASQHTWRRLDRFAAATECGFHYWFNYLSVCRYSFALLFVCLLLSLSTCIMCY